MTTARDVQLGDQVAELGAEFVSSGHRTMWALADEFGIVMDDLKADSSVVDETWYVKGQSIDSESLSEQLLEVWSSVVRSFRANYDAAPHARPLDRVSMAEWLEMYIPEGQYPELHAVLTSAYRSGLGLEPDEQSALNLVFLLAANEPESFWTFGDLDERFHCHDGNDRFVTELARGLSTQLELDARLEAVRRRADGSLALSFRRSQGGQLTTEAEHLVLALPFTMLRDVSLPSDLDGEKRIVIDELGYGTNAKVVGAFRSPIWRELHAASGSATTDLPMQQIWDASIGQDGILGEITSLLGGDTGSRVSRGSAEEWMCGVILPGLDEVFPGARESYLPGSAFRSCWVTEPYSRGSYSCYRPGQWSFEGIAGQRDGRIHFCGEHCSLRFQSWMEGAAETGAIVAAEVLDDLEVRRAPQHEALFRELMSEPHPCYHSGEEMPA